MARDVIVVGPTPGCLYTLTRSRPVPDLMLRYQTEFQALGKKPVPLQAALDTIARLENDLARSRADKGTFRRW